MKPGSTDPHTSPRIDWGKVHQQMEQASQALERDAKPTQDDRAILKARARALAQEPQRPAEVHEILKIVEFRLASEIYGIGSIHVREVYPLKDFTSLPGVPAFVLGIVNVRGRILSIVDLGNFFNLPKRGLGQLNQLIILHNPKMEFGILADEILGTRSIALDSLQAIPATISGIGADYVLGVTSGRVIILDAERILNDEKIIVHQDMQ
jgi:purine-binding chemotaxis protein CheW